MGACVTVALRWDERSCACSHLCVPARGEPVTDLLVMDVGRDRA